MKKYTIGEQHIYNCIMVKIRANWRSLILFKKGYAQYKHYYPEEELQFIIGNTYESIMTLYEVLESGFYINTETMRKALMNYRYFGKCKR